ncbi:tyrosine-type recombinase/integrase [Schlesneria paludicola]|uniref:tyrosine-type recombinase/integrase n=1 Tax=Schlesneria paludicola TaxID=360056 RepID=UPI00029A4A1C|nr:site-specific integrase [Schlesneria paludicola]
MAYKPSDVVSANRKTQSLNEWAAELGTPVQTLLGRLKRIKPDANIADAITRPLSNRGGQNKGASHDHDVLVGDEVDRLLNAGNKSETAIRDRALIVLAYRSGLRCAEMLALMPKDIDVERGSIRVHHGKGDKSRVVAMDPGAWAQVVEWMTLRSTWPITDASPLFCTRQGGPINSRQIRAMFTRRGAKGGIAKRVHAHGMRHTMASELMAEGVNVLDIKTILGHGSVATTNTYLQQINPASALDAMRGRAWGQSVKNVVTSGRRSMPEPGWLESLRNQIGDRLMLIHDGRASEVDFRAAVLLF